MQGSGRPLRIALLAAALAALLTGCGLSVQADDLYALPRLPAQYESLEMEINALLAAGAEHAAPSSGSNLQSVQMVDLDGDGVEEAVAFLRKAADVKPMKIYFFKSDGGSYRQMALIEGTASSIYSIAYADLTVTGGARYWSASKAARSCRCWRSIRCAARSRSTCSRRHICVTPCAIWTATGGRS